MNRTKQIDTDSLYPEPYCVIDNCLCQKIPNKNKMEPDIKKLCKEYAVRAYAFLLR